MTDVRREKKASHRSAKLAVLKSKHQDNGRAGGRCRPCSPCIVFVSIRLSLVVLDLHRREKRRYQLSAEWEASNIAKWQVARDRCRSVPNAECPWLSSCLKVTGSEECTVPGVHDARQNLTPKTRRSVWKRKLLWRWTLCRTPGEAQAESARRDLAEEMKG